MMTTSGTYTFNPTLADLIIEAYGRIQIQPDKLTARHLQSARMSTNLALQTWANRGVSLWAVDMHPPIVLTPGVSQYAVDPATVTVLDAYITTNDDDAGTTDRIIKPISRTDYASQPNKDQQGLVSAYWFDRTVNPVITLWQVPDSDDTYTLNFYRMRSLQDAAPSMGQTPDIHYRFTDAFASDLTARLAEKWAPALLQAKQAIAKNAWEEAAAEDREDADIFITPEVTGYFQV